MIIYYYLLKRVKISLPRIPSTFEQVIILLHNFLLVDVIIVAVRI